MVRFRFRAVPLAFLALAGCQLESDIRIEPNGAEPRFVVTYDQGKPACVNALSVGSGEHEGHRYVWAVRRSDQKTDASCADRFTYGVVPAGYELAEKAQRLAPGQAYTVNASGVGWSTSKPLTVR